MKKYEAVANDLASKIRDNKFLATRKLPSVRNLCHEYDVSLSTVVSALEMLENQRLVESKDRSGFYVIDQTPLDIPLPKPVAVLEEPSKKSNVCLSLSLMKSTGSSDIKSMSAAIPSSNFLPTEQLDKAYRRVLRDKKYHRDWYEAMPGNALLRQQIAFHLHNIGLDCDPGNMVITSGCQEAIMLSLRAITEPGDTIAVESPTYPGFLQVADMLHLEVLELPTDIETGVSLGALELAVDRWSIKALVLSANFSNPVGSLMPDEKKQRLVNMCRGNSIYIVEDDVYGDLSFNAYDRPLPLKSFDNSNTVVYCGSFSKTMSPGLRVGWMLHETIQHEVEYHKYASNLSTASSPQHVVCEYLISGQYEKFLHGVRQRYAAQMRHILNKISETFPNSVRVTQPKGGFILWLEVERDIDTRELLETSMHQGLSFSPGALFTSKDKYRNCLRLNCAVNWDDSWDQALESLAKLLS